MPVKVTAFACEWKCGRKVTTKRRDMVDHEVRCRLNPAARCCPTCSHELAERWEGRDCELGLLPQSYVEPPEFGSEPETNQIVWSRTKDFAMMRFCERWEAVSA